MKLVDEVKPSGNQMPIKAVSKECLGLGHRHTHAAATDMHRISAVTEGKLHR
jgi:hypothetical protein